VHLANWFFDGARADISKVVSANPAFQLSHAFNLGSSSRPASYNFGAVFANAQSLLQGSVDGSGMVSMRANQTWSGTDVTKLQGQVGVDTMVQNSLTHAQLHSKPGQSMLQIEHDHLGPHYALSLKTINPGILDGTGIHFVSLLHSVSPRLSLGFETIIQHPQPTILETATSYVAKLTSLPNPLAALTPSAPGQAPASLPFTPSWTATAQLQPSGNVQATYHQRMSDKIDVALDFQTIFQPPSMLGPAKREALCTLGAKYDLRMSCFRAQIDSNGKVGMLLEQRFSPVFAFLVSGEIDHAKVGFTHADPVRHADVRTRPSSVLVSSSSRRR